MSSTLPFITRFAPSPTGPMHLGNIVSAIYVWGFAQQHNGKVILRIEDHDRQRSKQEWVDWIFKDIEWLGLEPGTISIQSEHLERFETAAKQLIHENKAYICGCNRKKILAQQKPHHQELFYPGTCRASKLSAGPEDGLRFVVEDTNITWNDKFLGMQHDQPSTQCGDILLKDRKGNWTYQFAVAVDDIHENVNTIIRGEDLIRSTARQTLLHQALTEHPPHMAYAHHPLIFDPQSNLKFSKRTQAAHFRHLAKTPEEALGKAAFAAGLLQKEQPLRACELSQLF